MPRNERGILYRLYRQSKVWLNYLLDRVIDLCDMVLMDAYQFPWPEVQDIAQRIARYVGDISWCLRDFPRLSAYRLIGADLTVIFVGREKGLREICHLFFEEEVEQLEFGRVALWKLSAQSQQWLAEGIDLVICELGCIHPNRPSAPITFTVPIWIHQVLAIPDSLVTLIAGRKPEPIRRRINKVRKAGFTYGFSQSKADFDHFHYHMYIPFIKTRHGDLALVASYQDQWQRWFTRGGLVLVTQNDKPVAGMLGYLAGDTFFDVEAGILEADPHLFQQGINAFLIWCAMVWAHDKGAKILDMGGTHAWRSNGSFTFKQGWGARVVRRRKIYGTWTFLAQNLSPALRDHINRLGFISEIGGKFYGILLSAGTAFAEETYIRKELLAAQQQGLAGLAVVLPNAKMIIYDSASQLIVEEAV
jgi:hypothetical protein